MSNVCLYVPQTTYPALLRELADLGDCVTGHSVQRLADLISKRLPRKGGVE